MAKGAGRFATAHVRPVNPLELPKLPRMRPHTEDRLPMPPRFPHEAVLEALGTPKAIKRLVRDANLDGLPLQPSWWPGSDIEWLVYWYLTAHGVKFDYQYPVAGGRYSVLPGIGQVLDFTVPDRSLVLNVQGEYWHYSTTALRQEALVKKNELLSLGWRVVYVLGHDLQHQLAGTMEAALQGLQLFND